MYHLQVSIDSRKVQFTMVTAPVGTAGVPTRRRVRAGNPAYSMSFHQESCEKWCNFVRAVSTMGDNRTEGYFYCKR